MDIFDFYEYNAEAYDLRCRPFAPEGAPAGAMVCEVAPGQASRIHNHAEREAFLVLEGHGIVTDGISRKPVKAGQGVSFAPFVNHIIENHDATRPLRMISIYWMGDLTDAFGDEAASGEAPDDTLVFSTPPTPNGDLHLGHLSGPYLAGDILNRALRQRGAQSFHVTGRDDNQTYVQLAAMRSGSAPQNVADAHAAQIGKTLASAGIAPDGFITPDREGPYAAFVNDVIARLMRSGHIAARRAPAFIDANGNVLHEAYVRGSCPHCGAEADGNACEACGMPIACTALINPRDNRTGAPVRVAEVERLFFRLSALHGDIARIIKQMHMPARAYACSQAILDAGLPDIAITQPSEWGLPVRVPGFTDQIVYVWFEMAAGYLFGAAKAMDPQATTPDEILVAARRAYTPERAVVHCYGFDNTWYHTILFPAVHAALDSRLAMPRAHIVNALLDLQGAKFSTSRNHLIWAADLLREVPSDAVRFGLCLSRPQDIRSNFDLDRFLEQAGHLFTGILPQWRDGVASLLAPHEAKAPEPGAWLADQQAYLRRMQALSRNIDHLLTPDGFDPRAAARLLRDFAVDSQRFCAAQQQLGAEGPMRDYARTAAALGALGLKAFGVLAAPIMPDLAANIRAAFAGPSDHVRESLAFLPAGNSFDPALIAMPCAIDAPSCRRALETSCGLRSPDREPA